MRDLLANTRQLWYALYEGKTRRLDSNGDMTGDYDMVFSEPVPFRAHLSATRGTQGFTGTGTVADYFGADIDYTLIISTANQDLPIDEYSLIWKHTPDEDGNGNIDYSKADYRVTSVAIGLKHNKYAVKELEHTTVSLSDPSDTGVILLDD